MLRATEGSPPRSPDVGAPPRSTRSWSLPNRFPRLLGPGRAQNSETFSDGRHLHLRPAHRRREDRVRRAGRAVPLRVEHPPAFDRESGGSRDAPGTGPAAARGRRRADHPRMGRGRSGFLGTGIPRSGSSRPPASGWRAVTSATGSRCRTSRGGRLRTWSWDGIPNSPAPLGRPALAPVGAEPLRWVGVSASLAVMTRRRRRGGPHRPPVPARCPDEPGPRPLDAIGRTAARRPPDASRTTTGCASSAAATSAGHPSPRW